MSDSNIHYTINHTMKRIKFDIKLHQKCKIHDTHHFNVYPERCTKLKNTLSSNNLEKEHQ